MDHREASQRLLDYVGGRCDESTRQEVASHIEACEECRAWVEIHDLLASALERIPAEVHPDSHALAVYGLQPDTLDASESSTIRRHIESCAACREDLERVRGAVLEARSAADRGLEQRPATPMTAWWRIAAAACVAGVALWLADPFESRPHDVVSSQAQEVATSTAGSADSTSDLQQVELSEMEIEGVRHIASEGTLTLSRVKIMDGAQVTIQADHGVAFGDGFQIGSRTQIAVGANPAAAPDQNEKGNRHKNG